MGRHKYDTHRPAFGQAQPDATLGPSVQPTGEGVFDVVKSLAKKVGVKAVSGLARESGRKVGKEIVGTPLARAAKQPKTLGGPALAGETLPAPQVRDAGLEAQAKRSRPTPSARAVERPNDWGKKEADGDRIREILEANSLERKKTSPSKRKDERSEGRAQGVSNKANEVISRLLADDDDD